MTKQEAIKIITRCAKIYDAELNNKNILFVSQGKNSINYLETRFAANQFKHLTGVFFNGSSQHFLRLCIDGKLSLKSFNMNPDGTTEMKLSILPNIVSIHKTARMIGDYRHTKPYLITEKLAGGIQGCIGFVKDNDYYIPNTVLREDIRDLLVVPYAKIIMILSKPITSKVYTDITYKAKNINITDDDIACNFNRYVSI